MIISYTISGELDSDTCERIKSNLITHPHVRRAEIYPNMNKLIIEMSKYIPIKTLESFVDPQHRHPIREDLRG